jgi:hypothetical protein
VSRETYDTTGEAGENWAAQEIVAGAASGSETRTQRRRARSAVDRRRGIAPGSTADAAVFATRPGVVVL